MPMAGTGLRLNELRSLTLAQFHLDADVPYLDLHAEDEKNRKGAQVPLHEELVEQVKCPMPTNPVCASQGSVARPT